MTRWTLRFVPTPGSRRSSSGWPAVAAGLNVARLVRVQDKSWLIGQSAGAAGLSWFVAAVVLGHPAPPFAPIVAWSASG